MKKVLHIDLRKNLQCWQKAHKGRKAQKGSQEVETESWTAIHRRQTREGNRRCTDGY